MKICKKFFVLLLLFIFSCSVIEDESIDTGFSSFSIKIGNKSYYPSGLASTDITVFVTEGDDLSRVISYYDCNAKSVRVGGVVQKSGETVNDFRDYKNGVEYELLSSSGKKKSIFVRVLTTRLPVLSVMTSEDNPVFNRENWIESTTVLTNLDGSNNELGKSYIRGRGNATWEAYPKKPYNLKLGKKQSVLGMPPHKRWCLLALYRGAIANACAFEVTRRAPAIEWAPRGQFVELVLNGRYEGLYYLCEQVKIDENRINIAELGMGENNYPEVSGGYLLEFDELFDEKYKFRSKVYNLPVQLKSPNDNVSISQMNYIEGFINDLETELAKIETSEASHYYDFIDVENFADYWLALEIIGNYEAYKPRSVKMYKGRDGVDSEEGTVCKLKAGPLWDQEIFYVDLKFNNLYSVYYELLLKDPFFVNTIKERWPQYKSNMLGNEEYDSFLHFLEELYQTIKDSAERDISFWDNPYFTLDDEVKVVREGFQKKIDWIDNSIWSL